MRTVPIFTVMISRKTQKYAITLIFATIIGNCPYLSYLSIYPPIYPLFIPIYPLTEKGIIMKKIISVVVAVVVIWVGLKMVGVDLSVSLSPNKDEASEKKKLSPDNIIGVYMPNVSFPKNATDIHCDQWNADRVSYWIVAKLPKQDFYDLVEQLELKQRPDLLEFWPDAFDLKQGWMRKYW